MTTWVLYHAGCYDGFGAAWAAKQYFKESAVYVPMNYHDPLLDIKPNDTVYMVDYSRKRSEIEALQQDCLVTVIDHHKTAVENLEGLKGSFYLDISKSGAMLTWEYFFKDVLPPALIYHIQDRDLWKFELPDTKQVHAGLCSYPFDFDLWDRLAFDAIFFADLKVRGSVILDYHEVLADRLCEEVYWMDICGYSVPTVNTSLLFSEVPAKLLELYPDAPFAAYRYIVKGGVIKFGLRSKGDFDVSEVAKKLGGGGHKNAAGFELRELGVRLVEV